MSRLTHDDVSRGRHHRRNAALMVILVVASFIADLFLPLGIAGGVLYVLPVLLTMWLPDHRITVPTAIVCSGLTLVGFVYSPPGMEPIYAVTNRLLAVGVIWAIAIAALGRRRVERSLAESEALNRAIVASTADGILTLNSEGKILTVNIVGENILGYEAGALVGKPFSTILDMQEAPSFDANPEGWLSGYTQPAGDPGEIRGVHQSGALIPLEIVVVPLQQSSDPRFTITLRDIARRRANEHHLLRSTEEERRAIGYGLHEELGQSLTGLHLISRHLARRLEERNLEEAQVAADLSDLLHEADRLVLGLFEEITPLHGERGLEDAFGKLADAVTQKHGVPVTFEMKGDAPNLDDIHAAHLYRVVQELATLAADNGAAEMRWSLSPERMELSVYQMPVASDAARVRLDQLAYRVRLIGMKMRRERPTAGELIIRINMNGGRSV